MSENSQSYTYDETTERLTLDNKVYTVASCWTMLSLHEISCRDHTWIIPFVVALTVFCSILEVGQMAADSSVMVYPDTSSMLIRHEIAEQAAFQTQAFFSEHWLTESVGWLICFYLLDLVVPISFLFLLYVRCSASKINFCRYLALAVLFVSFFAVVYRLVLIWFVYTFLSLVNGILSVILAGLNFSAFYDLSVWWQLVSIMSVLRSKIKS